MLLRHHRRRRSFASAVCIRRRHGVHEGHIRTEMVSRMERLGYVGSDHFPILIDLRYTPAERDEHDAFESKESDAREVELRLERAIENDELTGVAR